ncbi:response regulator transcription factor [Ekhidna sp. To15]|uniref:response regulator transcription factor n=1 Tax=Ekhidna sp. To15 TaxID=3395267 RepID=UPI003F51C834
MSKKVLDSYNDIFSTFQEFKGETLEKHVEKLRRLDELIPHSETFFCVTNTSSQAFEYISKNFEPTMMLTADQMLEGGMKFWWNQMHPEEMSTWLQSLKDLMIFTMQNIALEDRRRMTYTWNYRAKDGNGIYKNIIQHTTPMFFDDEGKPIVGLAHYSVLEAHEILPIQATAKILNSNDEYETLFYQMYGGQKLLVGDITHRERDILRLISFGFTNDEISDKLNISTHTVKTHRKNVMTKTGSKNTTQLIAMCIRQGVI